MADFVMNFMRGVKNFLEKTAIGLVIFSTIIWCSNIGVPFLTTADAAAGEGEVFLRVNGMAGRNRITAGGYYEFEFELQVGASGIAADGANVQIIVPGGFTAPQTSSDSLGGYVSASSNRSGAVITPSVDGQNINISVGTTALQENDMIWVRYGDTNMGVNQDSMVEATTTLGSYTFTVKTDDTGADNLTNVAVLPSVQIVSSLVISEIAPNIGGTANAEFVEIYNNSNGSVDMAGWDIAYASASSTDSLSWTAVVEIDGDNHTLIPAFGYLLFAPDGYSPGGLTADIAGVSDSFDFEPQGGFVSLRSPDNTVIDKVAYGSLEDNTLAEGGQQAVSPANGSIERKAFGNATAIDMDTGGMYFDNGNGFDSDNNGMDFVYQATADPQNTSSVTEQSTMSESEQGMMGGPMVNHMPINMAPTGSNLIVTAQMGDPQTDLSQLGAELHYMIGDGTPTNNVTTDYQTVVGSSRSNGYFQFTIPSAVISNSTTNGLYYYLKLVGDGGSSYMSASPSADGSGEESQVAQNPFTVNCEDSSGWTTHSISGTVTDSDSAAVADALIFLEGTGYTATTSETGTYTLSNVRDDVYNLVITKSGYYEERMMNIFLNGADQEDVDRTMYTGMGGGMTGDNNRPRIMFTGPMDGMTGVPAEDPNFQVFIGFSKDMESTTITNDNIYLTTDGSTPISSTVSYDNDSSDNSSSGLPPDQYLGIVNAPAATGFSANTTYYLVMSGNVRDKSGNSLEGNRPEGGHVISFSTGGNYSGGSQSWTNFGTGDMQPPYVTGTTPNDGAFNIVPNTKVIINFAEALADSSVNSTNIKLYNVVYSGGSESLTEVELATVSLNTTKKIVTLTPASNLTAGRYRVAVSGAIQSAIGVWLGDPNSSQNVAGHTFYQSHFEVGTGDADTSAPTVVATLPADGATGIKVNPGPITIQFSESMDPASINDLSITLKKGTSAVTGSVNYDPMSKSASFVPGVVLAASSDYTLTIEGGTSSTTNAVARDVVGNALAADNVIIFSTAATGDTTKPQIMFANGDDYSVAVTFSESMNSSKVTNTSSWPKSVLNPSNYIMKYGAPGTDFSSAGTEVDLSSAQFSYEGTSNTVLIKNLSLSRDTVLSMDYFIDMASSTVSGTGAADLSGNSLAGGTSMSNFVMPVSDSSETKGMLGPSMGGGGMGGSMGPNMGDMGMMMAGAFPMNAMANQSTIYFVDIPVSNQIVDGYKAVLVFPSGFDVSGAKKDPNSPINNDVNEWNSGTITFGSAAESSGGASNDGVVVDSDTRKVTVTFAVDGTTPTGDFLHFDLAGIRNSSIPRDFNTSGYTVDMKIVESDGSLVETVSAMPFFITGGGSANLEVGIGGVLGADVDGTSDTVSVFLGSPMTGPIEGIASLDENGVGSSTFSGLPAGEYMIFTEPTITLDSQDYAGKSMPEPITLSNGTTTKTMALTRLAAGAGVAEITIDVNGIFGDDDLDVYAGSPNSYRVKTITDAGENPAPVTLYLGDGDWMVGMYMAMPKGPMSGPPPMPDWMPPMPVRVIVSDSGTTVKEASGTADDGTVVLTVNSASKQIIGSVKDNSDVAIADAEVWAYQPGMGGMGAYTKTDTAGNFTLKIAANGNYTVGVMKPGLPFVPEKSVVVSDDSAAVDGNDTCDVRFNGSLITATNTFGFKIKKPDRTISGKLTDGTNSVSYAPVWADRSSGQGHVDTMTDSSGNYILYVDSGTWYVRAYIPGYGDSDTKTVVVGDTDITQNLSPESTATFCSISGTVTIGGTVQSFMPLRAVQYNASNFYTGKEYGGSTASDGTYTISVPCNNNYRIDIWTPEYGEVGLATDEVANSPANVAVAGDDVSGKDITVAAASLKTVYLVFTNASSSQEGFLNIDGMDFSGTNPKPTGFHRGIRLNDLTAATSTNKISLPSGDYFFFLNVPGLGDYAPTAASLHPTNKNIDVAATRTVTFLLPDVDDISSMVSVSGAVTDGSDPITDAWVWIGDPTAGYHNGTQTDSSGDYSLMVPVGSNYKIGVDKPGYMSAQPADLTATTAVTDQDLTLTAASGQISGRLYADANSNGEYDSGEEVSNGFVRAETTDAASESRSPADGSGYYELGVVDGIWRVWGMADGYAETRYSSAVTVAGSPVTVNIPLTADSNWTNKSKMKPITPASGGSMDDTAQDSTTGKKSGTGVKLTVPPNALGSSANAGNINSSETSAVTKTNSFDPVDDKGVKITATDNSGQAITNLNDYIDVEMVLYKGDVDAAIDDNKTDYDKLEITTNGYWDSTSNDWVSLNTTKSAYYKEEGDTEWNLYVNAASSSAFEAFVDGLDKGADYEDYKLVYTSKTNHLTVFGIVTPTDLVAPSAPTGLAATASNGSAALSWTANSESDILEYQVFRGTSDSFTCDDDSQINSSAVTSASYTDSTPTANTSYTYYYKITAVDTSGNISSCSSAVSASYTYTANDSPGGGGSGITTYCSSVTYDEWGACASGWKYRDVLSKSPANCVLTTAQEAGRKTSCTAAADEATTTVEEISGKEVIEKITDTAKQAATEFAQKIVEILDEAGVVFKANINSLLARVGLKRDLQQETNTVSKYVKMLMKNEKTTEKQAAITNFVAYGTPTTRILGEGERAGVVNSYKAAFSKLPATEEEWQDVIKIANGRWPGQTSAVAEAWGWTQFARIYLRQPNMDNPHDAAAVKVISYGLRPATRNMGSEKAAIRIFRAIYGYSPNDANSWDIVRAIAYSGAKR